MKLSERLEALLARLDETTDGEYLERLTNGHAIALQCMEFVRDHGPALAELARSVEGAAVRNVVGQQWDDVFAREGNVVWCSDLNPGQRVRLVPDAPTPPAPGHEREGRQSPRCTCTADPSITCIVHPQEVPDGGR